MKLVVRSADAAAQANGGEIVSREEESDMKIADGKMPRKAAPGSWVVPAIIKNLS